MPGAMTNTFRIIGGKWRGRRLRFPDEPELRPTQDFIRETLFNWLAPYIHNACCFDPFAGSGALGFEALSRGARHVVMMDRSVRVVEKLRENAALLKAEALEINHGSFLSGHVAHMKHVFDIVFLDPPFHRGLVKTSLDWFEQCECLSNEALIYIEAESTLQMQPLLSHWRFIREKQRGQVGYYLCALGR